MSPPQKPHAMPRLRSALSAVSNLLFPRTCFVCGVCGISDLLCPACYAALPWLTGTSACPHCAHPDTAGAVCGQCLCHPPAFEAARAAFVYAFPADRLIHTLKYQKNLEPLRFMASHMAAVCERTDTAIKTASPTPFSTGCVLVPMPLHPSRLAERGFNQAYELARHMARCGGWPLRAEWAQKIRPTAQQAGLSRQARAHNVEGAFMASEHAAGAHILLIDDVMTTGASLNALASAFRAQGAGSVSACVFARTAHTHTTPI